MISFEDALYFKLLLEVGVSDVPDDYLEKALEEEEPLSDVALELAYSGGDRNAQLTALNKYLSGAKADRIDIASVVDRVFDRFVHEYESIDKNEYYLNSINGLVDSMYRTYRSADASGFFENNAEIKHFNVIDDYYQLACDGVIPESDFRECLEALLYKREFVSPWKRYTPRPGLFERIKRLFAKRGRI